MTFLVFLFFQERGKRGLPGNGARTGRECESIQRRRHTHEATFFPSSRVATTRNVPMTSNSSSSNRVRIIKKRGQNKKPRPYHMSIGVEYSVDPRRTSGGRYHRVTTSFEYVFVGTDLARANPKSANCNTHNRKEQKCVQLV